MDFVSFLAGLGYWAWLILGLILIVLETLVPGAVFMWLGVSALVVGGLVFFIPDLDWRAQMAIFSVLSVVSVVAWRRFQKEHPTKSDQPALNRRGQQYIGRSYVLTEDISEGRGRLRIDDTSWRIEGPDLAAGAKVTVTALEGMNLIVEAAIETSGKISQD